MGIIGKWELIESRLDPGDGGSTFYPVNSNARIELFLDETFKANFNICSLDITDNENSQGSFSSIEQTITPDDCFWNDQGFLIRFEIDSEDHLIISYPCIEPCQYKYEKVR